MGIQEVWLLITAQQALSAAALFCKTGQSWASDPLAKAGFNYGGQFLTNMAAMAGFGVKAAQAEFATKQSAEAAFASSAGALPPIA
jgi:hypothetical protein